MNAALAVGWSDSKKQRRIVAAAFALLLALPLTDAATATRAATALEDMVTVIVRELPGANGASETILERSGGQLERRIGIIDGYVAKMPRGAISRLEASPHVHSVSLNKRIRLLHEVDGFDGSTDPGSLFSTNNVVKSRDYWIKGVTGKGVDVALIDTGVAPVEGLTVGGKVVNGPDLSFEAPADNLHYLDTNGHGTHMAGIIAGRDSAVRPGKENGEHDGFVGVAPDARLVSLKVGNAVGATDVSQVLAAIDWVVQHRRDNGLNIRVLNLSFGTDSAQDYQLDPLAYAAEVAWHKGIVVVAAAGNAGFGDAGLNNPAYNPYVIAVGASDTKGTYDTNDDVVPEWSSKGNGTRPPDLVAPGKSVVSLRNPGSFVDQEHPEGYVNPRFFRGSGTSQAAAVVSGAAALILEQRPNATPDQVKALMMQTAAPMPVADKQAQGAGVLDMKTAFRTATPNAVQTWPRSTGLGSLDGARGSLKIDYEGVVLEGEQDIFGNPWDAQTWSLDSANATAWNEGTWNKAGWSGAGWSKAGWSGTGWNKAGWSKAGWSEDMWAKAGWSKAGWSGELWSKAGWSKAGWSKAGWSEEGWAKAGWSKAGWSGATFSKAGWSKAGWSQDAWSKAGWSSAAWGSDFDPGVVVSE